MDGQDIRIIGRWANLTGDAWAAVVNGEPILIVNKGLFRNRRKVVVSQELDDKLKEAGINLGGLSIVRSESESQV